LRARSSVITIISILSILFGLSGAAVSFAGIYILDSNKENFDNIHELSLSIADAIEEASAMLENSDDTSKHIADSIRTTKSSINSASQITHDSGVAFNEIAAVVGFEILGFKPLETTEDYFEDIGNDLILLSEDLETAQEDLEINASDMERIGNDLKNISIELDDVSSRLNRAIDQFSVFRFVLIIKYLLVYLGILNMMFVLNGIVFLSLRT
jgi:methyl-accepting chemotaxis protein